MPGSQILWSRTHQKLKIKGYIQEKLALQVPQFVREFGVCQELKVDNIDRGIRPEEEGLAVSEQIKA